ncbi:pectate lyase [Micromonospora zingiberis]|uniref:Pectate lyase n=1 Tax=Micromonospora zingiberis TaxID=2053011 RepID=A0A4R0GP72_9ACTN|nr:pectate lyase [Micromonospora zingiberis]TCB98512.1 pectate lyase [Micromonospora zingiberis]
MRRKVALRLLAALATTATGAAVCVAVTTPQASAAVGTATGFASRNGGTTGGNGGQTVRATTGTQIHAALCNRASSSTPIIIQVEGTINHGNTTKVSGGSCNTAADVIELKQISNVTILGVGNGALFDQIGIHIREASNIVIQNVTVRNVKKSGSPVSNGGDAIGMEANVRNVWVDHVTLEASGGESEGFDGLFDMKNNTQYVTLSYSILRNSGRGGLIGSSETDLSNDFITFHHNLYENLDSRVPLLRGGTAHIFNNHYVSIRESGINSRAGARAKVDNNYFRNSKDVLGTFYTNQAGYWQVSGNTFDNVTWSSRSSDNNPAGPNPTSNTSVSIPYAYSLDAASCVPNIVSQTAGANKGIRRSNGNCTPTNPTSSPTPGPTSTTPPPTSNPTPTPSQPSGTNLSLGADSDGSSKASGTSYGDVRDGNMSTAWSPSGATGQISIKWGTATRVAKINIREASGSVGNVRSWRVINHDTGAVLATGSTAGVISFTATSLRKITFDITSSSGTPRIAEFETYAS